MAWGCFLLFYKKYIVYRNVSFLFHGRYGYQYTKFRFSTLCGYWDTLVETEDGQQQQQQQGEDEELWKWTFIILTTFL